MPDLVDRVGAALLDASLAAVTISALVILVVIQSSQPARRRAWAGAGLLATLALPPLSALNPVPRFDLWRPILAIVPSSLGEPAPLQMARPSEEGPGPWRVETCEAGATGSAREPGWLRRVGRIAVLIYGGGAALGLSWLALGLWGSARVVRRARSPSVEAMEMLASLPFSGSWRRPRLLVSDRLSRPVLLGMIRPSILIPVGFDGRESADRLRLGLLHELAHAEASDHLLGPAASLAQVVWFFLPPVWWIRDRLRLDSEFLADCRAAAHFGPPSRYASALIDLASSGAIAPAGPSPTQPGPLVSGASALFQRILMLLRCPFPIEDRPPIWWRWSAAATIATATLAASCLTLRGVAGWSEGATAEAMEPARSFRLPRLVIAPGRSDDPPFDLRVRLPERFTLTLEIVADLADLPAIEILGHRLGPSAGADPARGAWRLWHRVEIRRAEGPEEVRVDDLPVEADSRPRKRSSWLTIRPAPGRDARIRGLDLAW